MGGSPGAQRAVQTYPPRASPTCAHSSVARLAALRTVAAPDASGGSTVLAHRSGKGLPPLAQRPPAGPAHLSRRRMWGHSHTSMLPSSPPSASRRPSLLKDMPLTGPMPAVACLNSPACGAGTGRGFKGWSGRHGCAVALQKLGAWCRAGSAAWLSLLQAVLRARVATPALPCPAAGPTLRQAELWRLPGGAGLQVHPLQAAHTHAAHLPARKGGRTGLARQFTRSGLPGAGDGPTKPD